MTAQLKSGTHWVEDVTNDDLTAAVCATIRRPDRRPALLGRTWARSFVSNRKYYYKRDKSYYNVSMSFDIETTRDPATDTSYMYIWQASINGFVIFGTTWGEWFNILRRVKQIIHPAFNDRVIVWVHNLGHEYAYMKRYISYNDDYFFLSPREPAYFTHDEFFEFRDSCIMVGGASLAKLAKDYTQTQKLIGDLDYSKLRNKSDARRMTPIEYDYCKNDVVILTEWADYYWKTYLKKHFCPITSSSVLRSEIKAGMSEADKKFIKRAYPDAALYQYLVSDIFRGGYVHANACYAGELLNADNRVHGVDYTSDYPHKMLCCYFPSKFEYVGDLTAAEFMELSKTKCVIGTFEFFGLRNTMQHSIESLSKCHNSGEIWQDKKQTVIDNGRILRARHVIVALTELDFLIYGFFYRWDAVRITNCYAADRMKLPDYVIKPMLYYYRRKSELKKAGQIYAHEKAKCNSFYGVMVTRLTIESVTIDEHGDAVSVPDFDFEKKTKNAFLLPQWGVYVTAWARFELLQQVYILECGRNGKQYPVLYCDTDSIKAMNWDEDADAIISEYNAENKKRVRRALEYYGISEDEIVSDIAGETLGDFDKEYAGLENFMTLGAKRYCLTYKGKFSSTIAGLPKNKLLDFYKFRKDKDHLTSPYEIFNDSLSVPDCKLAAIYYDEPTTAIINGEPMTEQTSVCLSPTSFSLGLAEDYKQLIEWLKTNEGKEQRR